MSRRLSHARISLADANAFIASHHRHHKPVVGHLFSLGALVPNESTYECDGRSCGGECLMSCCPPAKPLRLVGIAIVGRPVARMRDDGVTAEVTRLCTDGTRNACSFLYGASARAAFALGFKRIGTYILASETGTTLRAAGWRLVGQTKGGSWSRPSRGRNDKHPTEPKLLFEVTP